MKRHIFTLTLLCAAAGALFAQQPGAQQPGAQQPGGRGAGGGGGRGAAPQPIPLFFKETWKDGPGNVPVTKDNAATNPDLQVTMFGTGKEDFGITAEGGVPHIWTGLCATSCALMLSNKDNFVDLTGKARIRWYMKTSGFHEVRPALKLADGTLLVGDHTDADTFDYHESDFYLSSVHWMKFDGATVQPKGNLLDKVDLSKVDAVGFADLMPGSGHGSGGYDDLGWIEVYGKPVKRDAK